ncbi:hypothetical protein COT03_01350 [Candidatus Shapirobacteria bacterium CG07_land_8_20_14_0_80_39_18]|uniref:Peptidase A2 domain-containing protein n=1 Tax=Candidatus Shapirobacteria bacterium CG07_land_8_20_14_0_80_39_18 TaxID=1974882 RepID=A0A2M6YRG2_9BACT|nr:MAG: hypothetical protein COT03_01350 [Candidatus Shapirobacteria bacterium CG07_land_8_20_14_0_80_39_18]
MRFTYLPVLDFPNHQKRTRYLPWIRFGIANPKNKSEIVYPIGLIDSGSEITFVDYEIGEELGFDIETGKSEKVYGVGGGFIRVYYHKTILYIQNKDSEEPIIFEDWIAFSKEKFPDTMPQQTAILGTIGFFRHLKITFNYPKFIDIESNFSH